MRILFLNTWGGNVPGYLDYIEEVAKDADVLCLSEVHNAFGDKSLHEFEPPTNRVGPVQLKQFQIVSDLLRQTHQGYFAEAYRGLHDMESAAKVPQGLAMFIRRDVRAYGISSTLLNRAYDGIYSPGDESGSRVIQSAFIMAEKPFVLAQLHGLWTPRGKIDTGSRWLQNENIVRHIKGRCDEAFSPVKFDRVILGGDFNYTKNLDVYHNLKTVLLGDKETIVLNEQIPDGFNTRTNLYDPKKPSREVDMVFTGTGIDADLHIDRDVPSDHAALWVEVKT